jgi:hypothetical protein
MNKNTVLLILFVLFFAYTNSALVFAQNQSLSSQLSPPPKIDTNTTDLQNPSGQLQIPTEPPQGDATPLGGLGQQPPSQQQNQNQTQGPLEQLGESVAKMVDSNK